MDAAGGTTLPQTVQVEGAGVNGMVVVIVSADRRHLTLSHPAW